MMKPRLLALSLLLALAAGSAQAAQFDAFLKIDGIEGEATALEGFDIGLVGQEPQAGLLVPAVQKVRDAAARSSLAQLACDGAILPLVIVEVARPGGREPYVRYELTDALISGLSAKGGDRPVEELALNYEKIKWTYLESGESLELDCSSGRCLCPPRQP